MPHFVGQDRICEQGQKSVAASLGQQRTHTRSRFILILGQLKLLNLIDVGELTAEGLASGIGGVDLLRGER